MGYLDNSGLAYFWSKVKSYVDSKTNGGHTTLTIGLTVSGWELNSDGYYYQTATASGVTADNTVIADTDNNYIKCTAQAAGSLTFKATAAVAATIKVVIMT